MNRIFKLYSIKNVSVNDTMRDKEMDTDIFVEEGNYFIKSIAREEINNWLSIDKRLQKKSSYTIVEAMENTEDLRGMIINNLSECMKLVGYGSFAKTFLYNAHLQKYLAERDRTKVLFADPPKIKVLVEPALDNLVSSSKYLPDVIRRRLTLLLDEQFEIEVSSVVMSPAIDAFLTKVPVIE